MRHLQDEKGGMMEMEENERATVGLLGRWLFGDSQSAQHNAAARHTVAPHPEQSLQVCRLTLYHSVA